MANLIGSLSAAANSLNVFQKALAVVQNNVSNASTPGFAAQSIDLRAQAFDVAGGLAGGVAAAGLKNSRDQYAEESVQRQAQLLGQYSASAQSTSALQNYFDVSGTGGVAGALNKLFQSFSAWSATPGDTSARQTVISSASDAADSIRGLTKSLQLASGQLDGQIGATVDQINAIAVQIQQYNVQRLREGQSDPGADAQLYSNLQDLSQLTDFSTLTQSDGTITVMLAGGSPLVIGETANALQVSTFVDSQPPAANPQSPPTAHILDAGGKDVTSQVAGGQLGGLLDTRNRILGSLLGDSRQQGTLNQLAQKLANGVNSILQSGTVSSTPGAAAGTPLFTYSSTDATGIAASLSLNPAITPDQLAPVDASGVANGNANALAAQGTGLVQLFGQIAASLGRENQAATSNQQTQQQVLAQTKSLRDQVSGVSLDQQAVSVLEFQRAYQATAQLISVLNTVLQSTLDLIPH
jgi:flagellar hook-associated protein 1 FlgK